jgi:uncharacterized protein YcbK (DUF882 family)
LDNLNAHSKRERLSWRSACVDFCRKLTKAVTVGLLAAAVSTPIFVGSPSQAEGETRSLKIYYVHTGEKAVITYKRNGKFDPRGLEQLNRILRDWRKNQPTKMDPRLFDLIWEVYRESGSHEFIYVVCGFRSPETNEMLRTRNAHTGVAKKSQHMLGKAMDYYIPDVKLTKLREIGMKLQVGGVGYYPTSGSPFVHMDVGGVRAWPRMDRQELVRLFPDGKTMHIPSDGKPLPGYEAAVADYKRRMASSDIQVASVGGSKHRGFFAMLFGGGGADEDEDNSESGSGTSTPATVSKQPTQEAPAAEQPEVQVASVNAPIPLVRPAFGGQPAGSDMASALVSTTHSAAQDALSAALPGADGEQQQIADLKSMSVPVPSLLADRSISSGPDVASADPSSSAGLTDQLSGVPVPLERPVVADNLLAAANADPEAADDQADQNTVSTLSPAVVAALEERRPVEESASAPVPVDTAAQAIAAVAPDKVSGTPPRPMQVAALVPANAHLNQALTTSSSVPPPAVLDTGIAAGQPAKGGRPSKVEAAVANASRSTVRTEPRLTDKMISQWALTNARLELVAKPVKAPRFVSPTLRAQPTTVYTKGFTMKTASIDPARFSGSAVNFLEVRKFDSVQ